MIKCILITNNIAYYGGEELINQWQQDQHSLLWLDMGAIASDKQEQLFNQFNCHPLAIADAMRERHPPKVELFDDYIFILYRGILTCDHALNVEHLQVSMFVGQRLIITKHNKPSKAIDSLFNDTGERHLSRSPIHLALRIFHASCGFYLNEMFRFEAELEKIEDIFQRSGNDQMMRRLTKYQSSLVKLKRTFNYHVNVGKALVGYVDDDETELITDKEQHTVNDLNERLDRLLSLAQMYYDICADLINGYLSITSHQLNATMRVLTVITAVFVPLTFLAGIYGMNFENIPELKTKYGYFILLGIMAALATTLIMIFKKKKWL